MKDFPLSTLSALAAIAGTTNMDSSWEPALPPMPAVARSFRSDERGLDIAAGAKPGEVFTDRRGRRYVQDEKGTIRRCLGGL